MTISLNVQPVRLQAGLYMVATPIGNLKDISLRALEVLLSVDVVFCEDTRVTDKLLSHYGIKQKYKVYNDHSKDRDRQQVQYEIESGKAVALVSDAGTPLISDPGYKLIKELSQAGCYISSIPGAVAAITGLTLAAIPTDQFAFVGFLPPKTDARQKKLASYKRVQMPLITYERASRVKAVLEDILTAIGDTQVVVARELTKQFEEVIRGSASEVKAQIESREGELRGEVVLIIEPFADILLDEAQTREKLTELLSNHPTKEAAAILAELSQLKKRDIYQMALDMKDNE